MPAYYGQSSDLLPSSEFPSELIMCRTDSKPCGSSRSSSTVSLLPNYMQNLKEAMDRQDNSVDDEGAEGEVQQSLFADLCQIQLTLWTVASSTLLAFVWRRRFHLKAVALGCMFLAMVGAVSVAAFAVVVFVHLFRLRRGYATTAEETVSCLPLTSFLVNTAARQTDTRKSPRLLKHMNTYQETFTCLSSS